MPQPLLGRLARSYGTRLRDLMGDAGSLEALGRHYGAGLHDAEVRYLLGYEFAHTADDILWRRTKLGLRLTSEQAASLDEHIRDRQEARVAVASGGRPS